MIRFIFVILTWFSCLSKANCSFENNFHIYKEEYAVRDATKNFIEGAASIYVVADGFVPSRPGFSEKTKLNWCILNEFWEKQVALWTGADTLGACKDRKLAVDRATKYALAYNNQLIKLLKESGHNCFAE